ncbi:baeRF7 domain-containing protein [Pedobacter faecalis]|uniref:baeRF7 domain-containing protein n=1 Tax=Pedobacter faecalis TaxID=3041495 RepID=UPI00254D4127|nr:hypothetical protein [Pedobacter sp. ELA7]
MAKNKNGFTPLKGKPSGNGREGHQLSDAFGSSNPERDIEITEKYLDENEEPAASIRINNPNRHIKRNGGGSPSAQTADMEIPEMDMLTRELFDELSGHAAEHCISMFLPTHQSGAAVNEKQDAIRYKNGLQNVEAQLAGLGLGSSEADRLLRTAYEFYRAEPIWNRQSKGLAVFISDGYFKAVTLPYTVKEEQFTGPVFMVTPLLNAMHDHHFFLLGLSKHDAKFFQGDCFGMEEVDVPGLPNGVADVVHFEEKGGQQLFRQGGGGKGGASFHGHDPGQPEDKENVALYFKEVDRTLFGEQLHDEHAPLVLAGVDYLIPIYRDASRYKHIAETSIGGNPDYKDKHQLFAEVYPIVKPYFDEPVRKALENYYNQIATSLTSSMPESVIPASYYGKVSTLFICRDAHIWGSFDEMENRLEIHDERQPGDVCLIGQSAIKVIQNGGTVHVLNTEKMPREAVMAATMRF